MTDERKELIVEILSTHSCLTAKEIANFAIRNYNKRVSPAQVTGVLGPMRQKAQVATSKNAEGQSIYWLVK